MADGADPATADGDGSDGAAGLSATDCDRDRATGSTSAGRRNGSSARWETARVVDATRAAAFGVSAGVEIRHRHCYYTEN